MAERTFKDILEAHHTFPGEYVFRVIGATATDLPDIRTAIEKRLHDAGITGFRVVTQTSARGSYTTFRIFATVDSADQVVQLSDELKNVPGVRMVL